LGGGVILKKKGWLLNVYKKPSEKVPTVSMKKSADSELKRKNMLLVAFTEHTGHGGNIQLDSEASHRPLLP
jgi:hypothetical protein